MASEEAMNALSCAYLPEQPIKYSDENKVL